MYNYIDLIQIMGFLLIIENICESKLLFIFNVIVFTLLFPVPIVLFVPVICFIMINAIRYVESRYNNSNDDDELIIGIYNLIIYIVSVLAVFVIGSLSFKYRVKSLFEIILTKLIINYLT